MCHKYTHTHTHCFMLSYLALTSRQWDTVLHTHKPQRNECTQSHTLPICVNTFMSNANWIRHALRCHCGALEQDTQCSVDVMPIVNRGSCCLVAYRQSIHSSWWAEVEFRWKAAGGWMHTVTLYIYILMWDWYRRVNRLCHCWVLQYSINTKIF